MPDVSIFVALIASLIAFTYASMNSIILVGLTGKFVGPDMSCMGMLNRETS